jgi:hypothetical protein
VRHYTCARNHTLLSDCSQKRRERDKSRWRGNDIRFQSSLHIRCIFWRTTTRGDNILVIDILIVIVTTINIPILVYFLSVFVLKNLSGAFFGRLRDSWVMESSIREIIRVSLVSSSDLPNGCRSGIVINIRFVTTLSIARVRGAGA